MTKSPTRTAASSPSSSFAMRPCALVSAVSKFCFAVPSADFIDSRERSAASSSGSSRVVS
jgi:hypothetical protein